MFDAEALLGQMLTGSLGRAVGGNTARLLHGDGGTRAALGMGLLGVAIAAYEHYSATPGASPPPPPGAGSPPPPPLPPAAATATPPPAPVAADRGDALLLVRTMLAAAAADGCIDADERAAILMRADQAGLGAEVRAFLANELAAPPSPQAIAAASRPELAEPLYTAALLAIRVDTAQESAWLAQFGDALGLDDARRGEIARRLA